MRLYVVRHGQTEWNVAMRAQGHSDIPLDATGLRQAESLGRYFKGRTDLRVLSSDLRRALATALQITENPDVDPRLRERSFGVYEGRGFQEIRAEMGDRFLREAPEGGETLQQVWDRIAPVSEELRKAETPTVVVSHGGTAGILLAQMIQGTLETARAFRLGNATVTELERRDDGAWMILRLNDGAHLAELPAEGDLEGSLAPTRS